MIWAAAHRMAMCVCAVCKSENPNPCMYTRGYAEGPAKGEARIRKPSHLPAHADGTIGKVLACGGVQLALQCARAAGGGSRPEGGGELVVEGRHELGRRRMLR